MEKIAKFISFPTEVPKPYGIFHIISLIFTLAMGVFLIRILKNRDKRTEKRLFLIFSVLLVAGEVYKQFVLSFENGYFEYNVYFFPLQFCSTPLYVYPLGLFTKSKRLYGGAVFYSATYCLFAGTLVLLYPGSVFCNMGGINLQSVIHHAVMVIFGISLLIKHYGKFSKTDFFFGTGIFLFFLFVANVFNFVFKERVNMYYLNPFSSVKVPIVSGLVAGLPFPFAVFVYAFVYTVIALLLSGVTPSFYTRSAAHRP